MASANIGVDQRKLWYLQARKSLSCNSQNREGLQRLSKLQTTYKWMNVCVLCPSIWGSHHGDYQGTILFATTNLQIQIFLFWICLLRYYPSEIDGKYDDYDDIHDDDDDDDDWTIPHASEDYNQIVRVTDWRVASELEGTNRTELWSTFHVAPLPVSSDKYRCNTDAIQIQIRIQIQIEDWQASCRAPIGQSSGVHFMLRHCQCLRTNTDAIQTQYRYKYGYKYRLKIGKRAVGHQLDRALEYISCCAIPVSTNKYRYITNTDTNTNTNAGSRVAIELEGTSRRDRVHFMLRHCQCIWTDTDAIQIQIQIHIQIQIQIQVKIQIQVEEWQASWRAPVGRTWYISCYIIATAIAIVFEHNMIEQWT